MKFYNSLFILLILLSFSCKKQIGVLPEENITVLEGIVSSDDEKTLYIMDGTDLGKIVDTIVIEDHKFLHKFYSEEVKAYNLVSAKQRDETGGYMPVKFISEPAKLHIDFDVYDNEYKTKLSGGTLNIEYQKFQNEIRNIYGENCMQIYEKYSNYPLDSMLSKEANELQKMIPAIINTDKEKFVKLAEKREEMIKNKTYYSELGNERDSLIALETKKFEMRKYDFIKKNISIVGYSIFIEDLVMRSNISQADKKFALFETKFPNHSYTKLGSNLVHALKDLKPGGQYVNFTAPDIDGNMFELKSILDKNKVVLLDLWATWCGPCIAKTRLVKPVYDSYKDKGFTILGVAGEHKTLDRYKSFMANEQWEWQQLIELDKENKIWEKYNVMNGGGGMFLIASSGEILAVNPSAEEVAFILKERL